MERLSSFPPFGGRDRFIWFVVSRAEVKARRILDRFSDWSRLRSLPGNKDLIRAVFAADRPPAEGSRYRTGERLVVYQPDGERRRFKICGVRSGGFSNVYTVVDLDEMVPYCLKENRALPGDEQERNERLATEAEISLRLGPHPNIVATHAAYYVGGRVLVLTDYHPATSLDVVLSTAPLSLEISLKWAAQLCRAVAYAQTELAGFIHGDIKPGNCLVTSGANVRLGDFGLASATDIGKDFPSADGWGGTTAYMAPEMFDPIAGDRRGADIYAFGVTLFELLCGVRPFAGTTKSELIEKHREAPPPLHLLADRSVPGEVIDLVRQCLEKSREHRPTFESAGQLLVDVSKSLFDETVIRSRSSQLSDSEIARRAASLTLLDRGEIAVRTIDLAISNSVRSPLLLAQKAIALVSQTRIDEAYFASTDALRIRSDLPIVLLAHSLVLLAKDDLANAENYLLRALKLDPDNCVVQNLLGRLYVRAGQYDDAIPFYDRSLLLDASQPEPWEGLACINLEKGNLSKAISSAKRAISIDPRRAGSHAILAKAYHLQGRLVDAINSYKTALASNIDSEWPIRRFVRSCRELYEQSGGRTTMTHLRVLMLGAKLLIKTANRRSAVRYFATRFLELMRTHDSDPHLLFFFDRLLGKLANQLDSDLSESLRACLRIIARRSESQSMPFYLQYSLGRTLYLFGDLDYCRRVFEQMLEQFGPNESSYYYLAACCEIEKDYRASLRNYRKARRLVDSEDARTGINRVSAKLKRSGGRLRGSSVREAPGESA